MADLMSKVANQVINIHPGAMAPTEDRELKNHQLNMAEQFLQAKSNYEAAQQAYEDAMSMPSLGWKGGLLGLGATGLGAAIGTRFGGPMGGTLGGVAGLIGGAIGVNKLNHKLYPDTMAARDQAMESSDQAEDELEDSRRNMYEAANLDPQNWERQRVLSGLKGIPNHKSLFEEHDLAYLAQKQKEAEEAARQAAEAKAKASEHSDKEAAFAYAVDFMNKSAALIQAMENCL